MRSKGILLAVSSQQAQEGCLLGAGSLRRSEQASYSSVMQRCVTSGQGVLK